MTFSSRMLKTLKLLAISPVATVLWFGALGGMVWRLEPDEFGRDGDGSQVGNWIHSGSRRSPRLPSPWILMNVWQTQEGVWHVHTEGCEPLGFAKVESDPPLTIENAKKSRAGAVLEVWLSGERGLFARTESYWPIHSFERGTSQNKDSNRISPEIIAAIESDARLSSFAQELRKAAHQPVPQGQSSSAVKLTRPIWSGYVYNGVMVVLLLVGLHSMRWVYRGLPLKQLRQVWRPDGSCVSCGYSVAGLSAAKCPECGNAVGATEITRSSAHAEPTHAVDAGGAR